MVVRREGRNGPARLVASVGWQDNCAKQDDVAKSWKANSEAH